MIRKIRLISNNVCYGLMPKPDQEVEQRLTICSDGRAWLSRYCYGTGFQYKFMSKKTINIGKDKAAEILAAIELRFESGFIPDFCTDIGSWNLNIFFEDGNELSCAGSLGSDDRIEEMKISRKIRDALGIHDLYAFDGNYDDESDQE